jgi:hypothetical protein
MAMSIPARYIRPIGNSAKKVSAMPEEKEIAVISEAVHQIRNAQDKGLVEQHVKDVLLKLQSCGANEKEAAGMLLSGVVDAGNQNDNLLHASVVLETLK